MHFKVESAEQFWGELENNTRSRSDKQPVINHLLNYGFFLSDTYSMNGNELLKRLRKIARERRLQLQLVRERGKGSHGTSILVIVSRS